MERLYAPWRSEYTSKQVRGKSPDTPKEECIFCEIAKSKKDADNFVLKRGKYNFVMLNRFPYNAGHLLILPYSHTQDLDKLSKAAQKELMELLSESSAILKKTLKAEGINFGLNQGKAAGAGIPSHLHMHALPRWMGDTNFLPTLADTKQVSFDLNKIYKQLKRSF